MAETSLSVAARRVRRERRLSQRLGDGKARSFLGQAASWSAVFVGLTVGLLAVLLRDPPASIPAPVLTDEAVSDVPVYSPDGLRPALSPPDELPVVLPATYVVQPGDTLLSVAYRFGATAEAIRLASGLDDVNMLTIGQSLSIPPAWSLLREVDPDTTLRDVAESFGISVEMAAAYNGLSADLADVEVGRSIVVIPPGVLGPSGPAVAAPAPTPATADDPEHPGQITVYTVSDGDTILAIAQRLGVDPDALVAANRLPDSDWIVAGDQLSVPLWSRPAQSAEPGAAEEAAAAVAAAVEAPALPRTPVVYEVAPGDTVGELAERFGVDTETIINANDLISADRIRVGDQLTILPISGLAYTVRPGDTLADIASRFKVDLGPIIDFNYLDDADFITIGTELIVPGARPLPPEPVRPAAPTVYEVQPGDNLSTIARRFGISTDDLVAANRLRSADRLGVGDKLTIKAGAAASSGGTTTASGSTATASQSQTVTRNLPVPAAPAQSTAFRQSTPGGGGSVVSIAMQFQGSRYVFGGTTPSGFDCSGFVYYVLNRAGSGISRGMWGQYNAGSHPGRSELQAGDIVFFQNTYMPGLSHNGIYIGGGQFIHASDERSGVKISSLSESYWASRWFGATRAW